MTALKKPIKIKVIDEDELENEVSKPEKKQTKVKLEKKKPLKKSDVKKKTVVIKKEKKAEIQKPKKKIVKPHKEVVAEIAKEEEIDPIAAAVGRVSAVKNIVMARDDEKESTVEIKPEKVVESDESEDYYEENESEMDAQVIDYSESSDDEDSETNDEIVDKIDDSKGYSVKDIIASSINNEQEKQEKIIDKEKNKIHSKRSIVMYRRIAIGFAMVAVLLVALISYFSFVRVTIVLIPNQERINNNVIFDVHDAAAVSIEGSNMISGVVQEVKTEVLEKFDASGETILGQEAVGKVVVYNNHNKSQPLVATTRLLPASDPDKLFRITNTVNVPAGGSVEVEMYADDPGPEMAIDPTKFTIPGLWAGLQDKIYAKSSEPVVYQQRVKKYILQDDLDNGERYLKQKLISNVKKEIDSDYSEYGKIIYKTDENSIESETDVSINDELDDFEMAMSAKVVVVAFDADKAAEFAEQKFVSSLDDDKEMLSFDSENIIYSLNNFSLSDKTATINATFEGRVSLTDDSNIVDKEKIVGLNKEQLDAYLKELPDIAGYEVKFYPPFINKIPKLIELSKIKIEIKK